MDIVSQLRAWAESFLEPGLFIVDIEWKTGSRKVTVYLDGDQPVTIEQCRQLSRHLSEKLDEVDYGDTAYQFEVSSPGVDKPLLLQRQYAKHQGRELLVKLNSNSELLGRLESVGENEISLRLKDKKKGYHPGGTVKEIPFSEIAESTVQVSFR